MNRRDLIKSLSLIPFIRFSPNTVKAKGDNLYPIEQQLGKFKNISIDYEFVFNHNLKLGELRVDEPERKSCDIIIDTELGVWKFFAKGKDTDNFYQFVSMLNLKCYNQSTIKKQYFTFEKHMFYDMKYKNKVLYWNNTKFTLKGFDRYEN